MNQEERFDDIVQQKLNQRHFTPNEEGWKKAAALIEADRMGNVSRLVKRSALGLLLLICSLTIGTLIYFNQGTSNPDADHPGKGSKFADHTSNSSGASNSGPDVNADPLSNGGNSTAVSSTANDNNPDVPDSGNTGNTSANSSDANSQHTSGNSSSSVHTSASGNSHNTTSNASSSNVNTSSTASTSSSSSSTNASTANAHSSASTTHPSTAHTGTSGSSDASHSTTHVVSGHTNVQYSQNHSSSVNMQQLDAAHPDLNNGMQHLDAATSNTDTAFNHVAAADPDIDTAMQRLTTNYALQDTAMHRLSQNDPQLDSAMQRIVQKNLDADSSANAHSSSSSALHNGKVNFFFAEIGLTLIPGTHYSMLSQGNQWPGSSVNPVLGAGYEFHIGGNFSLQSGLRYTWVNNISDSTKSYYEVQYSFGSNASLTQIQMKRLHYFEVPLNLSWHFAGRNALNAGMTFNYLYATESRRSSTEYNGGVIQQGSSGNIFGYGNQLGRFDATINFGYGYSFSDHVNGRLSAFYGLSTLKNADLYGIDLFSRNKGFMFTLQYSF